MTTPQATAAPFATHTHIEAAAKLTPAEAKHLATVKGSLDRVNALSNRCRPVNQGQAHPMDSEIHEATLELMENATAEAAEKVHTLIVRRRDAELSAATISAATQQTVRREIEKLVPLALRVLTDAEAAFMAEAAAHRKATAGATTFASTTADFEARLEATRAAFAEKRRWVSEENASAHFLLLELGLGLA